MKKFLFSIFILSFLIVACGTNQTPSVLAVAPPPQVASNYCATAEANLKKLCNINPQTNKYCCDTVRPTLKNKTFTEFCAETQNNGINLNPQCLSTISVCDDIDKCTGSNK